MLSVVSGFFIFFIIWESIFVGKKIMSFWGRASIPFNVLTLPMPHHSTYVSGSSS